MNHPSEISNNNSGVTMNQDTTKHSSLEILKEAILLERRGRAFYKKAAEQAQAPEVKEFFEMMAQEELHHIEILETQFTAYAQNEKFKRLNSTVDQDTVKAQQVLSEAVKQRIATADFEAAAISAAMLMEERAITLYSRRADSAEDPEEAVLYRWLAEWEQSHLEYLVALDKDIKEAIWTDQQFWPF